jgi:hypothetical protein
MVLEEHAKHPRLYLMHLANLRYFMNNTLCGLIVLAISAFAAPAFGESFVESLGAFNSEAATPFKVPEQYGNDLKDYREKFIRLTRLEFSGLHWNQGIVIYINRNYKTYVDNYIGYLKLSEGLEDEDPCEEGDDPEEDECVELFSDYAAGTIVLKENYLLKDRVPETPLMVTLMIKHEPGYDPEHGDWEYAQFDSSGKLIISGNATDPNVNKVCAECHINMSGRDYLFSTFYMPQNSDKLGENK